MNTRVPGFDRPPRNYYSRGLAVGLARHDTETIGRLNLTSGCESLGRKLGPPEGERRRRRSPSLSRVPSGIPMQSHHRAIIPYPEEIEKELIFFIFFVKEPRRTHLKAGPTARSRQSAWPKRALCRLNNHKIVRMPFLFLFTRQASRAKRKVLPRGLLRVLQIHKELSFYPNRYLFRWNMLSDGGKCKIRNI